MNRREYIDDLKRRLHKLPYDEVKEAIDYYEEYFDDAGEDNEQAVIAELGTPAAVSAQHIAGYAVKGAGADASVKKNWQSAWMVVLALFASPIAVPLAIAFGAVALALIISLSAVILSFFVAGAGLSAGGAASVILSAAVITQSVPTTLFYLGIGLLTAGLGIAVITATAALSKTCFNGIAKFIGKYIVGRNKK